MTDVVTAFLKIYGIICFKSVQCKFYLLYLDLENHCTHKTLEALIVMFCLMGLLVCISRFAFSHHLFVSFVTTFSLHLIHYTLRLCLHDSEILEKEKFFICL